MFESFESDSGARRSWLCRPWPLAMLVILALLAVGVVYLTATGPKNGGAAAGAHAESESAPGDGLQTAASVSPSAVGTTSAPAPPAATSTWPTRTRTTAATAPTGEVAAPAPSVCALPAGDQQIPVAPPPAVWRLVGSVAVPMSDTVGPGLVDEHGVGDCFAHSPTGALFAAVGSLAALNLPVDQVDPVAVIHHRVAPVGDIYPAMVSQAAAATATDSRMPSEPGATTKVAVLGFTVTDYTAERAVLGIALGVGDPARATSYRQVLMPLVMAWYDGDWKLVYTDAMARPQPVTSADQYIGWAP